MGYPTWIPLAQGEPVLGNKVEVILQTGLQIRGEFVRRGDAFYIKEEGKMGLFGLSTVAFWRTPETEFVPEPVT